MPGSAPRLRITALLLIAVFAEVMSPLRPAAGLARPALAPATWPAGPAAPTLDTDPPTPDTTPPGLDTDPPGPGPDTSRDSSPADPASDWLLRAQADIREREYHVTWQERSVIPGAPTGWQAPNRAQNLRTYFYPDGIRVVRRTEAEPSWQWGFSLTGFGRPAAFQPVDDPELVVDANRLEYRRGDLVEWYVNSADGLEQGFTLARRPDGEGDLVFTARLTGDLTAVPLPGDGLEFRDDGGQVAFHYDKLHVFDATGRTYPARLELAAAELRIVVSDEGAVYPLVIDPLLSNPAWTAEGNQLNAEFGRSVATAGDVNGDGFSDVIIGSPYYDGGLNNSGRVFVYHGSAAGLPATPNWTADSDQTNSQFGNAVATAGDVNGDGYADVIIGAYIYANGEGDEGRVYVYHGSATGLSAAPDWTAESDQVGGTLGYAVGTAGDMNGDGFADVIVGAIYYDNGQLNEGRAFVYFGSADGLANSPGWTAESNHDNALYGYAVGTAGDVNGDGYADVIVGAPYYDEGPADSGKVFVYHGGTGVPDNTADWSATSGQASALFGGAVGTAGDVNGDGYADVIIGAQWYDNGQSNEGRAYVFHGSAGGLSATPAWTVESDQDGAQMGKAVGTAGDVNGDGYADVIVGAYLYDSGQSDEGIARVYHGSAAGLATTPAWTAESNQASAQFGLAVGLAGDVNGDGYADVIVGANYYDLPGKTDAGRAYVYHGAPDGLGTAAWSAEGNQASAEFGYSVSAAGDIDGDGYADVVIGAPYYDNTLTDEGAIFVYHGAAAGLPAGATTVRYGGRSDARLGYRVRAAGDVNGDGYGDLLAFAQGYVNAGNNDGAVLVYQGGSGGLEAAPARVLNTPQAGSAFGEAGGAAGDVNGDGYADIVIGASLYANPDAQEGAVFVYLGSAGGIATDPNQTLEGNGASARFGHAVTTAGDVDRDGYDDLIFATWPNGKVYVYYGGSGGVNTGRAPWMVEKTGEHYGISVGTAGDVNSDGYSDIIVGARYYSNGQNGEGRAYVYHGSAGGPTAAADGDWRYESNSADALFGSTVAAAGDVNGDGYGDVIVAAREFDNGNYAKGKVFVFLGAAGGLGGAPTWTVQNTATDGASNTSFLGQDVGTAGDVNGDGYADVLVGTQSYSGDLTDEGKAFLYYGNGLGRALRPQQLRSDGVTPIAAGGRAGGDSVRLQALGYTTFGRARVKLEWEVKPRGTSFDCGVTITGCSGAGQSSSWIDTGTAGVVLSELVSGLSQTRYHWRVRLRYQRVSVPWITLSRWFTVAGNGWNEADFAVVDGQAPTGTVTINAGAATTNATAVTLTLSANDDTGVTDMRFSADNATWTAWEAYATSKAYTLPAGDGTKTVYAQFRDGAGNVSAAASDTILLDTTAPSSATISIDGGAAATGSTAVTLTLSAGDAGSGVADMRFSNDNATWTAWEAYATSRAYTLPAGDGTRTVYVQFRDAAGNATAAVSDGILLDTTAPGGGSISIEGGATATGSTAVTLTLAASDAGTGVAEMRFSDDGATWTAWEAYATSKAYTLPAGDGTKTVYTQYRDGVGNATAAVSDDILLDTVAPGAGTISIADGAAATASAGVTLTLAGEADAGVTEMRFSDDGVTWTAWEAYATAKAYTLPGGDGSKTVSVQFRDQAGNASAAASDTILLDTTAPGGGTITIAGGAAATGSIGVTLTLAASDAGTGVAELRFADDGATWTPWEAYATAKAYALPAGDGTKTVSVQFRDGVGNVSAAASDGIVLDTVAPAGVSTVINGGDTVTATTAVDLAITASDDGTGVAQMRFSDDGITWTAWEPYATAKPYTLPAGDGTRTVYVQVQDAAGNATTASDDILLDTAVAGGSIVIAGGAAATATTAVTLTLTAPDDAAGVTEMRFSDDGATWSAWEAYATTRAYALPAGDGTRTVYVQFRDGAGNISTATSDSIVLDTVAPGDVSIVINGGAGTTAAATVALTLTASDAGSGVTQMRFSDDGAGWTAWEPFAASRDYVLPAGDGSRTVYLQVQDGAGNVAAAVSDSIVVDGTAPGGVSIAINGGAGSTAAAAVTLTVSAGDDGAGVVEMRFSDDGTTWSPWEAYAVSKVYTLPAGDGTKTVYAEFRDGAGNVAAASDSIVLDTVAPTGGSIVINGGAETTATAAVTLTLGASDAGTGVTGMRFSDDGSTWTAWESYATVKAFTLPTGDGTKTVHAQFRDGAGNESVAVSDGIVLDTTVDGGSITINGGDAVTASPSVTLTLTAADGGFGVVEMRFSIDGAVWPAWVAYAANSTYTLPDGDGLKTVYAQFRDGAGNVSPTVGDSILLDTTPPTGAGITINGGAGTTASRAVTLGLTATDAGSGVAAMRFSADGTDGAPEGAIWTDWEAFAAVRAYTLPAGDGPKTVYVEFRDGAGHVSSASAAIVLAEADDEAVGGPGGGPGNPPPSAETAPIPWPNLTLRPAGAAAPEVATRVRTVTAVVVMSDPNFPASEMRVAVGELRWPPWQPFQAEWDIELGGPDGLKVVYVQTRTAAGLTSGIGSAVITLDTVPPTGTIGLVPPYPAAGEGGPTAGEAVLSLAATDAGSGVLAMRFSDDRETWTPWETYRPRVRHDLPPEQSRSNVYVQYRDVAGNVSDTAQVVYIRGESGGDTGTGTTSFGGIVVVEQRTGTRVTGPAGPTQPVLSARVGALSPYHGQAKFAIHWGVSAGDVADLAGVRLHYSVDGGRTWTRSGRLYTASPINFTATADGAYGFSVQAVAQRGPDRDRWAVGEAAPTGPGDLEASTRVDTLAPVGSITIDSGSPVTAFTRVLLELNAADAGSGVQAVRLSEDGRTWTGWEPFRPVRPFHLTPGYGSRSIFVQFRDAAGNVSAPAGAAIRLAHPACGAEPETECMVLPLSPVTLIRNDAVDGDALLGLLQLDAADLPRLRQVVVRINGSEVDLTFVDAFHLPSLPSRPYDVEFVVTPSRAAVDAPGMMGWNRSTGRWGPVDVVPSHLAGFTAVRAVTPAVVRFRFSAQGPGSPVANQ